ncbi:hypothetical protein [Succinimonas amylolytica]|uniref:hypothetical protein n=1 Tax=Succinimonas amylolytica TaxID=83769 RepID=UPI00035E317C|nr:hypothetical protein [Succinimonas amylolytica]
MIADSGKSSGYVSGKGAFIRALAFLAGMLFLVLSGLAAVIENPSCITSDLGALLPDSGVSDDHCFTGRIAREIVIMARADSSSVISRETPFGTIPDILSRYPEIIADDTAVLDSTGRYIFAHRYLYPPYFNNENDLREAVFEAVYSPIGGLTDPEFQKDPFLIMRHFAGIPAGNFTQDASGFLRTERNGEIHYLLTGRIASGASLSQERGERLLAELFEERDRLRHLGVRLSFVSPFFYQVRATGNSVSDMTRIGGFSVAVLALVFIVIFRGLRELLETLFFLALFLGGGVAAVILILGHVHVITLGMGAALVGICADYLIHSLMFRRCGDSAAGRKLAGALLLSGATSIAAYLIMTLTSLLVLRELALLAAVSLSLALMTAILVVIPFRSRRSLAFPARKESQRIRFSMFSESAVPGFRRGVFGGAALLIGAGLWAASGIVPDDRVSMMQEQDAVLSGMDRDIRETLFSSEKTFWYLVTGQDREEAIRECEELRDYLPSGLRKAVYFPCDAVPSLKTSRDSLRRYREALPALAAAYDSAGLPLDELPEIPESAKHVKEEIPDSISWMISETAVLLRTGGAPEIQEALREALLSWGNVKLLDKQAQWNNAFRDFRVQLTGVLAGAFLTALAVLVLVMRKRVFSGFLLPVLGGLSGGILGAVFLSGGYFGLFSVMALFMILGLGADYCIFMFSASAGDFQARWRALLASWLTTEAAFGALAFSETRVLASFGCMLAPGLLAVFVLAAVLNFPERRPDFSDSSRDGSGG